MNILMLPLLRTAAEENDQIFSILNKINPVSRTPVDTVFPDSVKPLYSGCITQFSLALATVTFAAACVSSPSNHFLYGFEPSSLMYSSTFIERDSNLYVTYAQACTSVAGCRRRDVIMDTHKFPLFINFVL
jgi:hypothetical protein